MNDLKLSMREKLVKIIAYPKNHFYRNGKSEVSCWCVRKNINKQFSLMKGEREQKFEQAKRGNNINI